MRKIGAGGLLAVLLLVVAALLVAWQSGVGSGPAAPAANPATRGAAPAAPAVRELRLGLNIAAGSALHAAAVKFAERAVERSNGRLRVTVHPDQQLGSDDQMLEMAREGKLDLVLIPTAKLSSAIPAMQYADLPFYFSGREELYAMLDGEPGRMLLSKLAAIDLVGLTFWENGFKQFTANTPIRTPQDFARLRVRTMKSPLIAEQFASLGAQPIPIDFHATRQALAEGAVDGQENPLVAIVGMRFHEVQKHLTVSNHAYLGYVFAASRRVFETLPPDLREIVAGAARELTIWEREETARRETAFLETIRQAGVTIHTLTAEERQRFSQAMAPVADRFAFVVGYDLLVKTDELRQARLRHAGEMPSAWVLGLDADLSANGALAGGAIYRGMQLAVDEINQRGGVRGRPLRILARDHAGSPQLGQASLEQFAAVPNLVAVMGGLHTAVVSAELDLLHKQQIPFLIPWAAGQGLTAHGHQPGYTFRVALTDSVVVPFLLERALKEGRRIGVLLERSAWGRSNETVLRPLIERLPAGTVTLGWLDAGDPETDKKVDGMVAGGAEVLVMMVNPAESRNVVAAMARQARPIPMLGHAGITGGDFYGSMKTALAKVDLRFVQSVLEEDARRNAVLARLLNRYRERYGLAGEQPVPALAGTVHAYDLTHLLARALATARSSERAAVRDALESSLGRHAGAARDYAPPFARGRFDALDRSQLRFARFDAQGRVVRAE